MISNNKTSILVITELFPTPRGKSFSGIFVVDQLKELSKTYDIHIIAPYLISIKEELRNPIDENIIVDGLNVHYEKYFSLQILIISILKIVNKQFINRLIKKILSKQILNKAIKLHEKYNFKLVHGHEVFIGDEASNIGNILNIPSFLTIHSLIHYHQELFDKKTISLIINNINRTDHLITVSKLVEQSYKKIINKKFNIIPNGYSPKEITKLPENIKEIIDNKTVFIFAGFLFHLKRPKMLIKAVISLKKMGLKNFVVLIIGTGSLKQELKNSIIKENLTDTVYLIGEIDPKNMPSYFNSANVILQPSISESFSMICLEGMAYGKPFICTSNAGISEYITNEKEGFIIKPDDSDKLTLKMKLFIQDKTMLNKMGNHAHNKSKEFYWPIVSKKIIDLYNTELK